MSKKQLYSIIVSDTSWSLPPSSLPVIWLTYSRLGFIAAVLPSSLCETWPGLLQIQTPRKNQALLFKKYVVVKSIQPLLCVFKYCIFKGFQDTAERKV